MKILALAIGLLALSGQSGPTSAAENGQATKISGQSGPTKGKGSLTGTLATNCHQPERKTNAGGPSNA